MLNNDFSHAIPEIDNKHLNFFGEFVSKDDEAQYRQYILKASKPQARIIAIVVCVECVLFVSSDYILFGVSAKLALLLSVRLALIVSSMIVLFSLNKIGAARQFDRLLLAYILVAFAGNIYIQSTRPPGYTSHVLVSALSICLVYLVLPLPLRLQAISTIFCSLGCVIQLIVINPPADRISNTVIIFSFAAANLIGAIGSKQANYWKRQQFMALLRETELRQELEQALAEIKTLRGIIPICSYCKNIRNEPGDWEQIERYVTIHTHAKFSHGICPECLKKHFSDFASLAEPIS